MNYSTEVELLLLVVLAICLQRSSSGEAALSSTLMEVRSSYVCGFVCVQLSIGEKDGV